MMILRIGKRKKCNNLAGFTLIELVLVILLVSVFVGLSSPLFKRTFSNLELKNTSFNISKLINYAQEMAIIDRVNYRLNFDIDNGRYWITKHYELEDTLVYKRISGRYGRTFSLARGLVLIAEREEITFYPDGRCDTTDILIKDRSGAGRKLEIKGFGYHIKIEDIENE